MQSSIMGWRKERRRYNITASLPLTRTPRTMARPTAPDLPGPRPSGADRSSADGSRTDRPAAPGDGTAAPAGPGLTRQQALVLQALAGADGPTSAYALLDGLRAEGFRAPPQVYRALEKLIGYGLVHRVESLNAFVACAHPHPHRHGLLAFAICDRCGQVDEFTDTTIERRLGGWARDRAFAIGSAALELHGTCADCTPGTDATSSTGR